MEKFVSISHPDHEPHGMCAESALPIWEPLGWKEVKAKSGLTKQAPSKKSTATDEPKKD